jgi:4-azaleucine resistance transporter AzlC
MNRPLDGAARSVRTEALDGLRDIVPVVIAVVPISMLFGALAVGKGLSVAEAGLMSILVFAGGAQFAAVELWSFPVPIVALVFSTLLINARHVLMGTSLAPKLTSFSTAQKLVGLYFLVDESWALAERRAVERTVTPAYWFGLVVLLPVVFTGLTVLGAWVGSLLGDPSRLGADFAFTALFIGLIAGFWKGRVTAVTVAASGSAAALTYLLAGPPWQVAAGAFAGILGAYIAADPSEEDDA